jgi:hypothetical protein
LASPLNAYCHTEPQLEKTGEPMMMVKQWTAIPARLSPAQSARELGQTVAKGAPRTCWECGVNQALSASRATGRQLCVIDTVLSDPWLLVRVRLREEHHQCKSLWDISVCQNFYSL